MVYNGLQTSLRRRFSDRYSWDVNYTLSKSESMQGGDLSVYYITSYNAMQDFWNPERDYGPSTNDIRHRFNASFIYELPGMGGGQRVLNGLLGGWQISGIVQARSGGALVITQPSGIGNSRPDVAPGVDLVVADWHDSCGASGCNYLNPAGFVRVPVSSVTNATLRPGTYMPGMVRGPGDFNLHTTLAKSFSVGAQKRLQVRGDVFNLLNWKNYNNPQTNMNNADFGLITGAGRPRVFQVGARLTF
jgi:hypothetical protein